MWSIQYKITVIVWPGTLEERRGSLLSSSFIFFPPSLGPCGWNRRPKKKESTRTLKWEYICQHWLWKLMSFNTTHWIRELYCGFDCDIAELRLQPQMCTRIFIGRIYFWSWVKTNLVCIYLCLKINKIIWKYKFNTITIVEISIV